MEHFEIASYLALEAAADQAGLTAVAEMCRRISPDEERMAEDIKSALPAEVVYYLSERSAKART